MTSTSDLSLASVNSDWSTNEIARVPAPLKLVHDASCSSTPTLELQLNTTVESLTVTGQLHVRAQTCIRLTTGVAQLEDGYLQVRPCGAKPPARARGCSLVMSIIRSSPRSAGVYSR